MNILGYVVQYFDEDKFMPETGYKILHKHFSQALDSAKSRLQDYITNYQDGLVGHYELHTPTKKEVDSNGYVVVFRNSQIQIWIEVIIQ
jgi:hypothetical protein